MRIKYEIILWLQQIMKLIPGHIGCSIRNILLPYKHGKNVTIWEMTHIDKPSNLIIGNNVSINRGCIINAEGGIDIGNDVLIGPYVIIYSQNHNYGNKTQCINKQGFAKKKVTIGSNVWIAANVIILPGVTIGSNVVIGAGSVVVNNICDNQLVVGNPAKTIKVI